MGQNSFSSSSPRSLPYAAERSLGEAMQGPVFFWEVVVGDGVGSGLGFGVAPSHPTGPRTRGFGGLRAGAQGDVPQCGHLVREPGVDEGVVGDVLGLGQA